MNISNIYTTEILRNKEGGAYGKGVWGAQRKRNQFGVTGAMSSSKFNM